MAAASTDPKLRAGASANVRGALAACAAGSACVLIASGGAALSMRPSLAPNAGALWMSALALASMIGAPLLIARSTRRHTTLASTATLIVALSAKNVIPAYLNGSQHGNVIATFMIAMGGALLFCWRHLGSTMAKAPPPANESIRTLRPLGTTALLALLAGMSSGSLARFQMFALCGGGSTGSANGVPPFWQIALSLALVCTLACLADRSRNNRVLMLLYLARAALLGTLASADNPAFAPLAAKVFLLLDCLTIPALANSRGNRANGGDAKRMLSASCPGLAHHIGMLAGAALSTTPYFFGDGFVLLFALSATANLICAVSLATHWRIARSFDPQAHRYHSHEAHFSG
jgi:hypothetical protein